LVEDPRQKGSTSTEKNSASSKEEICKKRRLRKLQIGKKKKADRKTEREGASSRYIHKIPTRKKKSGEAFEKKIRISL